MNKLWRDINPMIHKKDYKLKNKFYFNLKKLLMIPSKLLRNNHYPNVHNLKKSRLIRYIRKSKHQW